MFFDDLGDANRDRVEKFRCAHTVHYVVHSLQTNPRPSPHYCTPTTPVTSIGVLV